MLTDNDLLSRRHFLALATKMLVGCHPSVASKETIKKMNVDLATKIGQMIIVGFRGATVDKTDTIVQNIQQHHLGGVILFDRDLLFGWSPRNIISPTQVQNLIAQLQDFASIPLFVATDYEGGKVSRLKEKSGFPATVSHHSLGQQANPSLTYEHASAMAHTLARLGFNLNLAPVVDLNIELNNPVIAKLERSFSADPEQVTRHALEFIKAHHDQGIYCVPKHFPGHGSSTQDSHLGLTEVTHSWSPQELIPYKYLIQAGQVDAIMTAHVFNAHLDATYPATLSEATITGLLREKLRYNGLILSDDIQMRALTHHYGLETVVHKSIEAGIDLMIAGNNVSFFEPNIAPRIIHIIQKLVDKGIISEARIDASFQRIQNLKSNLHPTL